MINTLAAHKVSMTVKVTKVDGTVIEETRQGHLEFVNGEHHFVESSEES